MAFLIFLVRTVFQFCNKSKIRFEPAMIRLTILFIIPHSIIDDSEFSFGGTLGRILYKICSLLTSVFDPRQTCPVCGLEFQAHSNLRRPAPLKFPGACIISVPR
jgi:hypothetical protein